MRDQNGVQYIAGDHLGTTSVVLDAGGTLHSEARHYPYGAERWTDGTLPTDYRFTGQRELADLGLYHMGARWYDPALARWLSADTLVPEPGNPQAFNRYSYVNGNPLRYLDPTGHSKFTDWLIEKGKKIGNSGPIGKALVVSAAEAVSHVNQQTQKIFYPDENTDPVDRFWACVEIGGVTSFAVVSSAYVGSLALGGGAVTAVTEAGGTAATAACADGDCSNELAAIGKLYHGTSSVHVPSLQQGINPPTGANFGGWSQLGEGFYTTPNVEAARFFANNAANWAGGTPTVVEISVKSQALVGSQVSQQLWGRVPQELITNFDYLIAEIQGYPQWSQVKFNPHTYQLLEIIK